MDGDVLVVGAGPTGLAVACGLQAAGIATTVVDGAAGPAVTSRARGVQPRGVEVVDRRALVARVGEGLGGDGGG